MIREAAASDAAQIADIYNHYISNTTITFETVPVSPEEMARRIESLPDHLHWLVYEKDGMILGYAYATPWRTRHAYRFSVESTVYVRDSFAGKGIGTELYGRLLSMLKDAGVHAVIGGIALPNEKSTGLHEKLGFEKVAQFKEVGSKFERWIDVGYWELVL